MRNKLEKVKPHTPEYSIGKVVANQALSGDYSILTVNINCLTGLSHPLPGQFYEIKPLTVGQDYPYTGSLLFKPLCIYDFQDNNILFMVKVVGEGTKQLSQLVEHDKVALVGPLGKPFEFVEDNQVLFISGGIGYAPLNYLKKQLLRHNNKIYWLHGGRNANDIFKADFVCSDDGSIGSKGLVTTFIPNCIAETGRDCIQQIYCCGPKAMMKIVWNYAQEYRIPAQFSMEEYMACGIGVCCGCALKKKVKEEDDNKAKEKYLKVCTDGPVFNGEEIDWNE